MSVGEGRKIAGGQRCCELTHQITIRFVSSRLQQTTDCVGQGGDEIGAGRIRVVVIGNSDALEGGIEKNVRSRRTDNLCWRRSLDFLLFQEYIR